MIKILPQPEQAEWVNACKGADRAKLNQIISDLNSKLKEAQETASENQYLESMRVELYQLIETLPKGIQKGWLDLAYNADEAKTENLLFEIKQKIATLEESRKPIVPTTAPQAQQLAEEAATNPQPKAAPKGAAPKTAPAEPEIPIW